MTVPPLPQRPEPFDGESGEHYVERLAYANGQHPTRLIAYLGIGNYEGTGRTKTHWRNHPTPEFVQSVATATGLARTNVEALFPQAVLSRLGLHSRSNWFHGTSSTACPSCISEGRPWRLEWRFAWTMLCLHHERFLVDTCTNCNRPVRDRSPLPHLNVCDNRLNRKPCGQRLDQLAPGPAADDHYLLDLQQRLSIATDALATGHYIDTAKDSIHEFMTATRYLKPSDQLPPLLHDAASEWFTARGQGAKFAPPPLVTAALALTATQ